MKKAKRGQPTIVNRENLWSTSITSGLIGLGITFASAFIFPLLILNTQSPDSLVLPMALLSTALGGIAGGVASAKKSKGYEFVSGIITAMTILLPLVLISFLYKKGFSLMDFAIIAIAIIASVLAASILTAKSGMSKKHNMKKLMKKPR